MTIAPRRQGNNKVAILNVEDDVAKEVAREIRLRFASQQHPDSLASVAKSYLEAMKILRPAEKFKISPKDSASPCKVDVLDRESVVRGFYLR
jgi:hypothetical protein